MKNGLRRSAALAAAAALAVPAIAGAHGQPAGAGEGHGHGPNADVGRHHANHPVGYVFAGTVKSIAGNVVTVTLLHGNHHAHSLVGQDVAFDVSAARIVVRDSNGDGQRNLADVAAGDRVQVLARLPRDLTSATQPFAARVLIDRGAPRQHHSPEHSGS